MRIISDVLKVPFFSADALVVRRCFSVGCTTAFGIVTRLDRLMLATKELVGEQYHIRGVGLTSYGTPSTAATDARPAKDV